ncbi:hypothetical protein BN946_scf185007.g237 [Trametes cinnabarina]|uniref:Histone deacetylase interacting domain-containing protein n=1 Tax=Pycnoporus cinnabarinus TaxID=5643 RepID=A0A060SF86_PYCCI|nr:hypothetical protein BN946_scf185007.g237 [Trametes cinnabarina]
MDPPPPSSTVLPSDHPPPPLPRLPPPPPTSPRRPKTADDTLPAVPRPRSPQLKLPAPTPRPGPPPPFLDSHRARASAPSSPSRPRSPRKTPRPPSPHPDILDMSAADGAGQTGTPGEGGRALNVSDALGYLDAVKQQFQDKPDVYNHFLDIMKDFKSQVIDTPGVIERVSMLFHGNPYLIQGFNTFLPPGYRIELNNDHSDTITVTTPMGQMTQRTTMYGVPTLTRDPVAAPGMAPPYSQPPFGLHPPPVLPVGIGNGSRPVTPIPVHGHPPPHIAAEMQGMRPPLSHSPALHGGQDNSAVSMLNSLNTRQADKPHNGEFHHAINYLNKIKQRYHDDPETYKQFLEILQTYQKEQRHMQDQSQVYAQVQMLFKDAPDLMDEFKDFLPEAAAPPTHPAGLVGILPQPTAGPGVPGSFGQPDAAQTEKATKTQSRRRKRPEKEAAPPAKSAGGRAVKRAKTNQKPDTASPKFSPYQVPHSPQPVNVHVHPAMPAPMHPPGPHPIRPASVGPGAPVPSAGDELLFFDRAKKALESGGTYDEFLKLLNLFSRDIIDTKTLIDRAEIFLGDGDLMAQFKDLLSWDDKVGNRDEGPPGSLRTSAPDYYTARPPDDGQGPSYRRLPDSEVRLACSGRDRLCWSVLNDEWVSHPTWASEEAGFMTHKKNSFEDTLHKSEEERHEFQVHIEALTRTIAVLEPLEARIENMSPEERAAFRLKPNLGGMSRTIYERIIKRIYGYDAGNEVLRALQESPAVAVPVVLARLRRKDEEWRRAQREWNRTWREIDAKNFYKALDHQGITFKQNDKKNITAKHFVLEIESAKAAQVKQRDREAAAATNGCSGSSGRSSGSSSASASATALPMRSLGYQLEYSFEDVGVLHDAVKLVFSYLDHSPQQFSQAERRGIERFLRAFIPVLFMFSPQEFNNACGPLAPGHEDDSGEEASLPAADENGTKAAAADDGADANASAQQEGVSAQDLRKRLLKTAQENAQDRGENGSTSSASSMVTHSTASPPAIAVNGGNVQEDSGLSRPSKNLDRGRDAHGQSQQQHEARTNPEDIWVGELKPNGTLGAGETPLARRPFFAGTTFYTLLRLLQLLYSRLLVCKEIGARMAAEKHASLLPNPIAVELGLDEPNGPSVVLQQAMEAFGGSGTAAAGEEPNVLYAYLLDACEKVFENELDQATFEEHMRWFFRTKADNKCQELWYLLQQARGAEKATTIHELIRYRREAERHVASDEKLYRLDWDATSKKLRIQLMGPDDPTADEDESAEGRWRAYVASYVMVHPTEWIPAGASSYVPVILKRNMPDGVEEGKDGEVLVENGMRVQIQRGTYKVRYERGTEDVLWRRRGHDGLRTLQERAVAREEERRRLFWRTSADKYRLVPAPYSPVLVLVLSPLPSSSSSSSSSPPSSSSPSPPGLANSIPPTVAWRSHHPDCVPAGLSDNAMRSPKPFSDHSPLTPPGLASSSASSSSSSASLPRSPKRPSRTSSRHALSPGSLPDPSSGLLALLVTVAGSSSSADARPLDDSHPDSPPDFLCPRLHSWSPSEHTTSSAATPSWVLEPCDASEAAAFLELSIKRRRRRTRRGSNIADKYVKGPDGRWRKADSWELYGSSSCPPLGCMDDPAQTDRPVQDDQVTASASGVTSIASSSTSSSPNLPAGWDKNRDDDNLTGMILGLSLSLAVSLIIFMIIVVRWRHGRRTRHRKDAEKTPSLRSAASLDESEELKRARQQQRLWARASANWVAKVRQSARRRRKRKAASAAMDADGRALREAQASSSAVSLARTHSAPANDSRRSAASSTHTAHSRSPTPTAPDRHEEAHYAHPLQHPPAYPHGSSSAYEPAYSHWHSHTLDLVPSSGHAPDIPPPPSTSQSYSTDRSPPPSLSPLPYEPPVHSAHVAVDDKTVLARLMHLASAPPLPPHGTDACGPSTSTTTEGGLSDMRPSVPVLHDDPFEDALPPNIESLDSVAHAHTPSLLDGPRCRAHDVFSASAPLALLPYGPGPLVRNLGLQVPSDTVDALDADGIQEEGEIPSYAEDVLRHPPLVLPPPPAKVPMVGPTFYEYPDEFERDIATVEPVTGPSAPPFEHEYAPPSESSDDAARAAAAVVPSAPPLEFADDAFGGLEGLIPSASPVVPEDEAESRTQSEGSASRLSSTSSSPRSRSCSSSSRSSSSSRAGPSAHAGDTVSISRSPSTDSDGSVNASPDNTRDSQALREDADAARSDLAPPRYLP